MKFISCMLRSRHQVSQKWKEAGLGFGRALTNPCYPKGAQAVVGKGTITNTQRHKIRQVLMS